MTEKREKMLDKVIRKYGFEHPVTIEFAQLLESPSFSDKYLEILVKIHTQ